MQVLLTGAGGFIPSHVAEELTARLLEMEIGEGIHGQANTPETPPS